MMYRGVDFMHIRVKVRSCGLCPVPPQSELCLALSNGNSVYDTHDGKVYKLWIGDKKMAKDPHDSLRKNELITGRHIPLDIYKG